ncbi:MAG: riboflavin synthase [Gemmatimonadaceae bacterium]
MFTGLIETIGEVEGVRQSDAGREIRIRAPFTDVELGESIAVNGACLTVRDFGDGWFQVAAVVTTTNRTTIAGWNKGTRLNLERSLQMGDRLGGHIVQGHVDCVGVVTAREQVDDALLLDISAPPSVSSLFVLRGSVTVDGVSLTINDLRPSGLQVSVIEYTLRHTTLGDLGVGSRLHVEADMIAKHVRRLLEPYLSEQSAVNSVIDFTLEH